MKFFNLFLPLCWITVGLLASASQSQAQQNPDFEPNAHYRLTCEWLGPGKSLDVISDGRDHNVVLANSGSYSGQYWKITPLGEGYYRLTTEWKGPAMSLDVVNDGQNNRLCLARTANYAGQAWRISPQGRGYYRLTTQWQGPGKSLDVVNDGKHNKVQLARTGDFVGQYWKITKLPPLGSSGSPTAKLMLTSGQTLTRGSSLASPNQRYKLIFQKDGNLAYYGPEGQYIWDAGTDGEGATCVMQRDGNLVIYDQANRPVWSSETQGYFDRKFTTPEWKPVKLEIDNNGVCGLISATDRVAWSCEKKLSFRTAETLSAGQSLPLGAAVISPNRRYILKFQQDGNLAFYGPYGDYIWDAGTNGRGATCVLQRDGNLVIYDRANQPVWSSETQGYFDRKFATREWKPVRLRISDGGKCALLSETNQVAWSCGQEASAPAAQLSTLKAGESMARGAALTSADGRFTLKFQSDGNLAFYGPGDRRVWDAGTSRKGEVCVLQRDGNLVIYDRNNNPVWSSETQGYFDEKYRLPAWKPVKLEVNDKGQCALISTTGQVAWQVGEASGSQQLKSLEAGQAMERGTIIVSPNGRYALNFQPDGNLAFYGPNNRFIWDAKTRGKGETCVLQRDGNLVIYDKDNNPVWSSETMAYFNRKFGQREWKPVRLAVSNSGKCALLSATNRVAWSVGGR